MSRLVSSNRRDLNMHTSVQSRHQLTYEGPSGITFVNPADDPGS
jgi:hypothetical protein